MRRLVDEGGRGLAGSALLPAFTVTLCSGATNREQSGCQRLGQVGVCA